MRALPRSLRTQSRSRRGAVLLGAVIFFLLVVALVGVALDTAFVRKTNQELQAAADSAALAATEILESDTEATQYSVVRQAAVDCAVANEADRTGVQILHNYANAADGDVVVGVWDQTDRSFTPDTATPNAVRVTARRTADAPGGPLSLLFGGLFGTSLSEVSRSAIATRGNSGGPAVVLVLDPAVAKAFDMRGNSIMVAYSGAIQVNSNHPTEALYLNGKPEEPRVRTNAVKVTGVSSYPTGAIDPDPIDGSPVVPDPLAGLPYPDPATMPNRGGILAAGSYDPGYYPDGIDFNGGVADLAPGIYYIGAPVGVNLHGSALLRGEGVMLFLALDAPFVISGIDAGMDVSAPSSGTYEGLTIFAHRDSDLVFDISGTGLFDLVGTMYMAGGHLEMDGTVDRKIGRIIVNSLQFRGNGVYEITGEGPPDTVPLSTYLVR